MKMIFLAMSAASLAFAAEAAPMMTVAAQPIERGAVISARDLTEVDASGQPRRLGILDARSAIGMEARRTIQAGQPLYGQDVQKPLLVKRNQVVTLVHSRGGLAIAASGKAMGDAAKGDLVRVQNSSSRQIVEGEVAADGVVRVGAVSAPQIPTGF